jgi:hypothetical protein
VALARKSLGALAVHYFAFHDDVIDNPKVMSLPSETYRFWTLCLCIASRQTIRGTLPDVGEIAFRCRCSAAEAEGHLSALVTTGLIARARGELSVPKWDERQPYALQGSAARTRKYREAKKAAKSSQSLPHTKCDVTCDASDAACDATVTLIEKDRALLTERSSPLRHETGTNAPSVAPPHPPTGEARGKGTVRPPDGPEAVEVGDLAEELFPMAGMAPFARRACAEYPAPWVVEALRIAAEAKATRWKFVESVLGRFRSQGGPDSTRASPKAEAPRHVWQNAPGDTLEARKARARIAGAKRTAEREAREAAERSLMTKGSTNA